MRQFWTQKLYWQLFNLDQLKNVFLLMAITWSTAPPTNHKVEVRLQVMSLCSLIRLSHILSLSCILSLLTKLRLLCSASIWVVSWTVQSVFTTTKKNRMSNAQLIHIQSGRNIENRLVFISSLTGCVENWSTKKLNKSSCSGVLHTYKVLTPKACAGG